MLPKVSVIVPVYNADVFIDQCLMSLKNQTYKNLEVIIVNDGSTDNSEEKIKFFLGDRRFLYYKQENKGPSTARNYGIEVSKGKYVLFVDSDDTLESNYVETLVKTIKVLNTDVVACGYCDISKYRIIDLNDFWMGTTTLSKDEFINSVFKGVGGTLWGKIFKKEIIIDNNLRMNPHVFMSEDLLFVLEYSLRCNKFGVIKESLYHYNRLNDKSITSKMNLNYYNNLMYVNSKIEEILESHSFDKNYVDCVLSARVQSQSFYLLIAQHREPQKSIYHMDFIVHHKYFDRYKSSFYSKLLNEKILIYLIKKEKKKLIYYYTFLLYSIQRMKESIKNAFLLKRFSEV